MPRSNARNFSFLLVSLLAVVAIAERSTISLAANATPSATPSSISDQTPQFQEIHMFSKTSGWAVITTPDSEGKGENKLYYVARTADGGQSWLNVDPQSSYGLVGWYFLDDSHAWAATAAGPMGPDSLSSYTNVDIWRTNDSGQSWKKSDKSVPTVWFIAANFIDLDHGWLLGVNTASQGGDTDLLYRTMDGGATWQLIAEDDPKPGDNVGILGTSGSGGHTGIAFSSANVGWIVQEAFDLVTSDVAGTVRETVDTLLTTTDGGKTWKAVNVLAHIAQSKGLSSCVLPQMNETTSGSIALLAYCSGSEPQALIYQITDQGKTIQSVQLPSRVIVAGERDSFVPQAFMINQTTGWFIGDDADTGTACCGAPYEAPTLYQTVNGGKTWAKIAPLPDKLKPPFGQVIPSLTFDFIDANTGWVIASAGELLATSDAGKTWQLLNPAVKSH